MTKWYYNAIPTYAKNWKFGFTTSLHFCITPTFHTKKLSISAAQQFTAMSNFEYSPCRCIKNLKWSDFSWHIPALLAHTYIVILTLQKILFLLCYLSFCSLFLFCFYLFFMVRLVLLKFKLIINWMSCIVKFVETRTIKSLVTWLGYMTLLIYICSLYVVNTLIRSVFRVWLTIRNLWYERHEHSYATILFFCFGQ